MSALDPVVREFLAETHENLGRFEVDVVGLEQDPTSRELISSIFRTIHTVKGTCGFLGYSRLETLTHAGENLLSRWRDGEIETGRESIDLLLRMVDVLRRVLAGIEATGTDDVEADAVQTVIAGIAAFLAAPKPETTNPETPEPAAAPPRRRSRAVARTSKPANAKPADAEPADVVADPVPTAVVDEVVAGEAVVGDVVEEAEISSAPKVAEDSVRVGTDVLDALMRQVGELVLSRNRLGRLAAENRDPELMAVTSTVRAVVHDLQASVMKTRMQPVSQAWQQVPRLVRDLAASLDKRIELETTGGAIELDRALIDTLRDPLTHLVRNAADHGLESAEERGAAGKPAAGKLTLHAYRQGGTLVLEVTDDGRGLDLGRISERAVAMGLLSAQAAATASESDLVQMVFRPAFSTAAGVSRVSGRGVGMDVVKNAVEGMRGSVQLTSRPGAGTTCRLTLPVTVAVTPSVTVEVEGQRFAVPHSDLRELVRVDGTTSVIEEISGAPVYRLRDQMLPVVVLGETLGLHETARPRVGTVAVLAVRDRTVGLLVDAVLDTEEILVERLDTRVGHLDTYAGAAVLADGRVCLVLDLHAVVMQAAHAGEHTLGQGMAVATVAGESAADLARRQCVVALVSGGRRIALPMAQVSRLEDFDPSRIEHLGAREVVQYRGEVVPLLRLGRYLDRRSEEDDAAVALPVPLVRSVPAIVCARGDRTVALAVDEVIDIVLASGEVALDSEDARIAGALLLHDRVTELLDVDAALLAADASFFAGSEPVPAGAKGEVA